MRLVCDVMRRSGSEVKGHSAAAGFSKLPCDSDDDVDNDVVRGRRLAMMGERAV